MLLSPLLIVLLWIGSAIAGWFWFGWWLAVPLGFLACHAWTVSGRAKKHMQSLGFGNTGGSEMTAANVQLVAFGGLQHAAIFGITALIRWAVA